MSWLEAERAFNFALYSKHASSVQLLFFDGASFETPRAMLSFDPLKNKSGRAWHCHIPESTLTDCRYYAYSIDGPDPRSLFQMHAFHPEKVLLDPCARELFFHRASTALPRSAPQRGQSSALRARERQHGSASCAC